MNAQNHRIENQPSQLAMNTQDLVEYMSTQIISEAALAENWIHIFEYYHPTQMHVLTPDLESDQRIIIFICGWFAFAKIDDFIRLDAIASDPHMVEFHKYLLKHGSSAAEPRIKIEYPDKTYTSFDDWYSESGKPKGWVFDEETHRLVAYTYWLSTHNASMQAVEQEIYMADAQFEEHNAEATQHETDLSSRLEHMQIDEMMSERVL
ncbi:hypothetical protein PMIN06_012944 [Paraphaeosphaeria minitans]